MKSIKDLECKNIGQREGLSKLDIQKINLVYNCKKNAPEAEPEADAAADAWYSYYGYGTVIPDTTVHTADITVVDGVNTMVDITGTLAMNRY